MQTTRFAKLSLLALAASTLALAAPGCASATEDGNEDYSEEAWSSLSTVDTADAVLEDADATDDDAEPPAELDELEDVAEAPFDDVDDEQEPESVASLPEGSPLDVLAVTGRAATFRNAVLPDCADPGVIRTRDGFLASCTGGGYPTFASADLVHWKRAGHIFHAANRPKWVGKNWWAPEIHAIGDGFVAYFSGFSTKRGRMCIGAARGPSATGPWIDIGRPLVCSKSVGLIDVNAYTDREGRHFLYYKTDGNALSPQRKTVIFGHRLGADGVSFLGRRRRLLKNTLPWEGDVVEAPWVVGRGKYYFMFYSGFRYCNGTYGVGVARARSPLGPFRKKGGPILHSNAGWAGPGHNSVVRTGGHDWIVYHAYEGAHECGEPGGRSLLIDRISWKMGWPSINNGTPSRGRRTAPVVP